MQKIVCTLDRDINNCPYYDPETSSCKKEDPCNFGEKKDGKASTYVRKKRWYEKYYKQ